MTTTSTGPSRGRVRKDAAARLNQEISCEELAERLGLERGKETTPKGTKFKDPDDDAKHSAQLMCYSDPGGGWTNFRRNESGSAIDLMMRCQGLDFLDAVRELGKWFGIDVLEAPAAGQEGPRERPSLVEHIAHGALKAARTDSGRADLLEFLEGARGLSRSVVERAMKAGTLGLNTYENPRHAPGEYGHGGPGASFIVLDRISRKVVAVDTRYFDPETAGGKTNSQGEKDGVLWCSDWRRVEKARRVYIVESSINALSVESALDWAAAVALRGTSNAYNSAVDWSWARGKEVVLCCDNDAPLSEGKDAGFCPGLKAAWALHETLTALDVSCLLVDQSGWFEDQETKADPINDVNDYLQLLGPDKTGKALQVLEAWLIPGMAGDDTRQGKPRLHLPHHDYLTYWKYRVKPDFTQFVTKMRETDGEDGEKIKTPELTDVCGFRVAAVSRVAIASPQSTMTGDKDHSPRTVFALSVQVARHGALLQRRVVDDERLHNLDVWKKLGPVFAPGPFARMVNLWERAANIGARDAINFVGLAWRDGQAVVNEGPDCFFADPRQQCPYHELVFPSGTVEQGREVVAQFGATFAEAAALIPLVWGLGAHIKAFIGFWPHFVMQAEKATGKTTLVKRIERAIAMVMSSRQSLQTEFRQMTSLSYTSHPVGWGEMSTNKQDVINKAIHNLQESYQYEHTRRGAELMDFLLCAPVLLAGEDVPVDSLVGKIVRSELTKAKRGPLIPEDVPVFPVKQWLRFLAKKSKADVQAMHLDAVNDSYGNCVATPSDTGAERMVNNYAAVATGWRLLCEFLGLDASDFAFLPNLWAEMNRHIAETVSDRQPWAWIVEKLLSEIAAHKFQYPFVFDDVDEAPALCIRTGHVMDHMRQTPYLREFWDGLPVKSDRVFKRQLEQAGVLFLGKDGHALPVERTVKGQRVGHMVAMPLEALRKYGLYAVVPKETRAEEVPGGQSW
jgi:hypothetical protein